MFLMWVRENIIHGLRDVLRERGYGIDVNASLYLLVLGCSPDQRKNGMPWLRI